MRLIEILALVRAFTKLAEVVQPLPKTDAEVPAFLARLTISGPLGDVLSPVIQLLTADVPTLAAGVEDLDVSDPEVCAAAAEAGIDPATVMLIIQAVVEIIKLWQNRRKAA